MRKILFRGKLTERFADAVGIRPDLVTQGVIKDNFVYGSLVIDNNKCFICTSVHVSNMSYVNNVNGTMFEVDPETVGQFTGLVDKNGKKIFEGDIIESSAYMRYVIKYDIEYAMFAKYIVSRPTHFEGRLVNINAMTEVFEIIGDIYNNPELLKEASRDIINETVQRCLAPATKNFELLEG